MHISFKNASITGFYSDSFIPERSKGRRQGTSEGRGHFLHIGSQLENLTYEVGSGGGCWGVQLSKTVLQSYYKATCKVQDTRAKTGDSCGRWQTTDVEAVLWMRLLSSVAHALFNSLLFVPSLCCKLAWTLLPF